MGALAADRNTAKRTGSQFQGPVAAAVTIYKGALLVRDSSGNIKPGVAATGLMPAGMATEYVDNSAGAAADLNVNYEAGTFRFANKSGDELTKAEIGDTCYIQDDQTVCKTSTSKSPAGKCVDVDSDGVWVLIDPVLSNDGDLVAANNLSDVSSAATSRANLGANKVVQQVQATSLVSAGAAVYRMVAQVAGVITKVYTVLNDALATGDVTLTGKIGATAITNGAVTITQSGSAAGDVDSATPTAARTVAVGDVISFTVGGTNTADVSANIGVLIET